MKESIWKHFFVFLLVPMSCFGQEDSIVLNTAGSYISTLTELQSISLDSIQLNAPQKDSLMKEVSKSFSASGVISNEFNYGLLTGYIDSTGIDPMSVFESSGAMDVGIASLPVSVSYRYSNWRNPIGINNYFRVRLNTEALKENARNKLDEKANVLEEKKEAISEQRGLVQEKVGYGELLLNELNQRKDYLKAEAESQLKAYETQLRDSINERSGETQNEVASKRDSIQQEYAKWEERYRKVDSIYYKLNAAYTKAYAIYASLQGAEDSITSLENSTREKLESIKSGDVANDKLDQIKTLELGLTYPKSTALSNNSVPMQGLNLELQRKQWYTSVAAGILKSNLNVSPNLIENKLNNSQNLFNQFDFQSLRQEQLMAVVKTGIGNPESSHAFIGFRYMKARDIDNGLDSTIFPSLGVELETKWTPKFVPGATMEFVYGKTSLNEYVADRSVFKSIFSNDRTNTALVKYEQRLNKLKSKITATYRVIDPFADVQNLGILQPNNVRYMLQSQHKIAKRMTVGLNYRHDENNIAQLSDTTDRFDLIGGVFNGSVGRFLTYFGTANYLVQRKDNQTERLLDRTNYILGAGVSVQYQFFKNPSALVVSYNDYLITDTSGTGVFSNFGAENSVQFNNGRWIQSVQYFTTDYLETFTTSTIFSEKYEHDFDNLKVGAELKYAITNTRAPSFGWGVEASYTFFKQFEWVLKAEKFVLGDYYSTFNRERFDRFPYRIMTQINWKFNY